MMPCLAVLLEGSHVGYCVGSSAPLCSGLFLCCLLARNLYASVKALCPIFVLDWLNTGPLGLILA